MSTSYTNFLEELYEEHIEEASFLYEQRLAYLDDPEVEWLATQAEEQRLEAHIDALVIGSNKAIDTCRALALDGDMGATYVLVTLYCRQNLLEPLLVDLNEIDYSDEAIRQSIYLALSDNLSSDWIGTVMKPPLSKQLALFSLFIPALIKQKAFLEGQSFEKVLQKDLPDLHPTIQAAGQLRDGASRKLLAEYIAKGDAKLKQVAMRSMLQMGYQQAIEYAQRHLPLAEQPLTSMALGTNTDFFHSLFKTPQDEWSQEVIDSITLGGLADHIPILINSLEKEELAPQIAQALFIITGAPLTETKFLEDNWEEEDLFEDELEAFKEGNNPQRLDGQPYGEEVEELTLNPDHWRHWWHHNQSNFVVGARYRLGRALSPIALVQLLIHPRIPHTMRELSYQELLIRYQAQIYFSTSDWIHAQQQSIRQLYQWAQQVDGNYSHGRSYFAGSLIDTGEQV